MLVGLNFFSEGRRWETYRVEKLVKIVNLFGFRNLWSLLQLLTSVVGG